MPRKRGPNKQITVFGSDGPMATRQSRTRTLVANLTRMTGDPEQDGERWLSRIQMTHRQREAMRNGERDWRKYYRWYEGEMWDDRGDWTTSAQSDNPRDTATVNKLGSVVNSMVSFLVNGEMKFLTKAEKPGEDVAAMLQKAILNYEWRRGKMHKAIKACAKDATIIGHCIGKVGYTVEVDSARNPARDGAIVFKDYIKKDAPWVERVDPLLFLFDLSARDYSLRSAEWCCEIFYQPLVDILANKDYDQDVLGGIYTGVWSPEMRIGFNGVAAKDPTWAKGLRASLPEDHLVPLLEIWDRKFKQRIIYAAGISQPLFYEPWPYNYLDNFPYIKADYIDIPNKHYGMGVMRWCEDQAIQLNQIRTAQFEHVRANTPRYKAAEGTNPDEIIKFTDGGANTVVVGEIEAIQMAPLINDFQIVEGRLIVDIEEATGADALVQGTALGDRTTAGEVATRSRITGLKLDSVVSNIEEFTEDAAVQVLHHLKANRTVTDVIEVTGPEGTYWHPYTPQEIQADADVSVESFSAPRDDQQVRQQQWLKIFQLSIQALPVLQQSGAPNVIDVTELLARVLEEFDEQDIGRFFIPARSLRPPEEVGQSPVQTQPQPQPPGPGAGLPPALAGQMAPGEISTMPQAPANPQEGLSIQDMLAGLRAGGVQ